MNFSFSSADDDTRELVVAAVVVVNLLVAIVHVCFALAVYKNASGPLRRALRKPIFVGPFVWALATLLGGVFVAAIYWGMHYSRLNTTVPEPLSSPAKPPVGPQVTPPPGGFTPTDDHQFEPPGGDPSAPEFPD